MCSLWVQRCPVVIETLLAILQLCGCGKAFIHWTDWWWRKFFGLGVRWGYGFGVWWGRGDLQWVFGARYGGIAAGLKEREKSIMPIQDTSVFRTPVFCIQNISTTSIFVFRTPLCIIISLYSGQLFRVPHTIGVVMRPHSHLGNTLYGD